MMMMIMTIMTMTTAMIVMMTKWENTFKITNSKARTQTQLSNFWDVQHFVTILQCGLDGLPPNSPAGAPPFVGYP
jgi:NhaP-type Na+/H+ or K+/H+ antiporter